MMSEVEYQRAARQEAHDADVKATLDPLMGHVNGGLSADDIGRYLMNEHPTLAGQLAKGVALGIIRRTMRDEKWRPFDKTWERGRACTESTGKVIEIGQGEVLILPPHHEHDGRFSCETIVGAELVARQAFI